MLKSLLFATALTAPFLGFAAPANAFPITCPDGVVVEFGQLCPLPPWQGGPQPVPGYAPVEPGYAPVDAPDPAAVNNCSLAGGVWNDGLHRCDILPAA